MTPTVPRVLDGIAATLSGDVLPEVRSPFAQQSIVIASDLCRMIAQEFDRAAARLFEENGAIMALFEQAIGVLPEGALAARLRDAAAAGRGGDLRVSALQAENDRLRALLIDVHAAVESIDTAEARALDARTWDELRESTRRRHLESGMG